MDHIQSLLHLDEHQIENISSLHPSKRHACGCSGPKNSPIISCEYTIFLEFPNFRNSRLRQQTRSLAPPPVHCTWTLPHTNANRRSNCRRRTPLRSCLKVLALLLCTRHTCCPRTFKRVFVLNLWCLRRLQVRKQLRLKCFFGVSGDGSRLLLHSRF